MRVEPEAIGIRPGGLEGLLHRNIVVLGITRSGKTHFVRHLHMESPLRSVFWNPEHEGRRSLGRVAYTAKDAMQLLRDGERRVNILVPENEVRAHAVFADLQRRLFTAADRLRSRTDALEPWLQIAVDEAHEYMPETPGKPETPGHRLFKRGLKRGIPTIAATQRAADLSKGVYTQGGYIVIFDLGDHDLQYLRRVGIPTEEFAGHIRKPHHFVIVAPGGRWVPYDPI